MAQTTRKKRQAKRQARRQVMGTNVGKEYVNKMDTPRALHRFSTERFDFSSAFSNGTAVIQVDTGPFTYQLFMLEIVSNTEIVGKTVEVNGRHLVKTDNLDEYVSRIQLRIDGQTRRDLTVADIMALNGYRNLDVMEGHILIPFGGPGLFEDPAMEDLYMLGTKNVRDLRIHIDFTDDYDATTMHLEGLAEYAPLERNIGHFESVTEHRYTFAASGTHTITDLPTHSDLSHIIVFAEGIGAVEFKVDNVVMADGNVYDLNAINELHGRDTSALGDHFMWDGWRAGEAVKGIRGLRSGAQARRNADLRIKLDLAEENTEVRVVLGQCGSLASQN